MLLCDSIFSLDPFYKYIWYDPSTSARRRRAVRLFNTLPIVPCLAVYSGCDVTEVCIPPRLYTKGLLCSFINQNLKLWITEHRGGTSLPKEINEIGSKDLTPLKTDVFLESYWSSNCNNGRTVGLAVLTKTSSSFQ